MYCMLDLAQCLLYMKKTDLLQENLPLTKKMKTEETNKIDFKVNAAEIISFQPILFLTCDFFIITIFQHCNSLVVLKTELFRKK